MADIATVFHASLSDLGAMSLPELGRWRERARARAEAMAGKGSRR